MRMHPRRLSWRVIAPMGLLALGASLVPAALAQATTTKQAADSSARTKSTRMLVRRASLASLGDGVGHLPPGTNGSEFPPGEEGAGGDAANHGIATRSHSVRHSAASLAATAA